ncbi:unnamed protein product [Protopolystoma xenopodis]|uniref:Uncharacterized protein n=1 Tax=Protopolystoma xenopodis TaxID=117903 RepID=A0A448XDW7_9PLAT|nr:unnamed protein product [Protopolystoma xenopodis]
MEKTRAIGLLDVFSTVPSSTPANPPFLAPIFTAFVGVTLSSVLQSVSSGSLASISTTRTGATLRSHGLHATSQLVGGGEAQADAVSTSSSSSNVVDINWPPGCHAASSACQFSVTDCPVATRPLSPGRLASGSTSGSRRPLDGVSTSLVGPFSSFSSAGSLDSPQSHQQPQQYRALAPPRPPAPASLTTPARRLSVDTPTSSVAAVSVTDSALLVRPTPSSGPLPPSRPTGPPRFVKTPDPILSPVPSTGLADANPGRIRTISNLRQRHSVTIVRG